MADVGLQVRPYSSGAKTFHWLTVIAIAVMLPTGFWMTSRAEANIWDGLTNNLFSTHKLVGFLLLILVVLRLVRRFAGGVPPPEPTLTGWMRGLSALNHAALYGMLLVQPLLGWLAASLYPALSLFDCAINLPALTTPDATKDKVMYEAVANWHAIGAFTLIALLSLHIVASLYHLAVRHDGVFWRMWPGSAR